MNQNQKDFFTEAESAIAPIDDVIRLLFHAHDSFHLGDSQLTEAEQFNLISQHEDLGCILRIAINVLSSSVESFNDIHQKILHQDD